MVATRPRTLRALALVLLAALIGILGPTRPAHALSGDPTVRAAQAALHDLGLPVPVVDGYDGAPLRRALCAWRRLSGHEAHRGPLDEGDLATLLTMEVLPPAPAGRGVTIDKTCQASYFHDGGTWQRVVATSTGRNGLPRVGDYRVQRKRAGWHTSTLYWAPRPNMYNTIYFNGAIALHGSNDVPFRPASRGCARLELADADFLFERLERGDVITVVGSF